MPNARQEPDGKHWHPEPCPMAWYPSACNCIGCVYREIAQRLHVGLFSSWGQWPR